MAEMVKKVLAVAKVKKSVNIINESTTVPSHSENMSKKQVALKEMNQVA